MTMRVTMRAGLLSRPITMKGSGFTDLRRKTGRFTFDMSGLAEVSQGKIPAGATMDEIMVYPVLYMRSPTLSPVVPDGKWGKFDLGAATRQMGVNIDSYAQSDPTQYLRYLSVAGEHVKRVGRETIRGVGTTHYTATLNLRKTPDFFPAGPKRDEARKSVDRLIEVTGEDSYPVAVWVDGRSMIRRMHLTMNMKVQGQRIGMDMAFDLFNFGRKPRVKPPPAADVVELPTSGAQPTP